MRGPCACLGARVDRCCDRDGSLPRMPPAQNQEEVTTIWPHGPTTPQSGSKNLRPIDDCAPKAVRVAGPLHDASRMRSRAGLALNHTSHGHHGHSTNEAWTGASKQSSNADSSALGCPC